MYLDRNFDPIRQDPLFRILKFVSVQVSTAVVGEAIDEINTKEFENILNAKSSLHVWMIF
jgi:hypothetical protein